MLIFHHLRILFALEFKQVLHHCMLICAFMMDMEWQNSPFNFYVCALRVDCHFQLSSNYSLYLGIGKHFLLQYGHWKLELFMNYFIYVIFRLRHGTGNFSYLFLAPFNLVVLILRYVLIQKKSLFTYLMLHQLIYWSIPPNAIIYF